MGGIDAARVLDALALVMAGRGGAVPGDYAARDVSERVAADRAQLHRLGAAAGRGVGYSASRASTGPLSWPLALVSRSTNSMTAMSAASPMRVPALMTRM